MTRSQDHGWFPHSPLSALAVQQRGDEPPGHLDRHRHPLPRVGDARQWRLVRQEGTGTSWPRITSPKGHKAPQPPPSTVWPSPWCSSKPQTATLSRLSKIRRKMKVWPPSWTRWTSSWRLSPTQTASSSPTPRYCWVWGAGWGYCTSSRPPCPYFHRVERGQL